ncbi:MAG: transposase [Chloroflexi bacterium]|nr:transposase [Chloroflexota bacterium]
MRAHHARGIPLTLLPTIVSGASLFVGALYLIVSPLWALVVIAGTIGVLIALQHPEYSLLGILVLTSSVVFESDLPLIPIGVGSLHIPDVILLGLFGMIALRWLLEPDFHIARTPLDAPLLFFFGITFGATLWAIMRSGLDFNIALRGIRIVSYYLVFFAVTNLIRSTAQLARLLDGFLLLATVVGGVMFLQFLLGDSLPILPGRVETLSTQGASYEGIARILPPGQSMVLVGFVSGLIALLVDRLRPTSVMRVLQVGILGLAVILTFNRNFWINSVLSLALFAFLIQGRERHRAVAWSMALGLAIVMLLLIIFTQPGSSAADLVTATVDRFSTMVGSKVTDDSSLRWRDAEYEYAIPQILSHPLTGLGAGALYRPFDSRMDSRGRFDGRGYIHNGHLWIMLQSGVLGYASLMWLSLRFVARGLQNWRQITDSRIQGIALSLTLVNLFGLLCNITSPLFMQWYWTPVFGLMMGANEVIYRLYLPTSDQPPGAIAPRNAWAMAADAYRQRAATRTPHPTCPGCGAATSHRPAGNNPSGSRRFQCAYCGRIFTPFPNRRSYPREFKLRAVRMVRSGNSKRQVARDLNVSPQSVVNWVRAYDEF